MPHFVAPGKSITTPRGIVTGGDPASEIAWNDLCKRDDDEAMVKQAKESHAVLVERGVLVEAASMPITPAEVQSADAADGITQEVDLNPPGSPGAEPEKATPEAKKGSGKKGSGKKGSGKKGAGASKPPVQDGATRAKPDPLNPDDG